VLVINMGDLGRINMSLVVLGLSGVGKTSLIKRWIHPTVTPCIYDHTIGIEVISNMVRLGDVLYTIKTWDTAGKEFYDTLLEQYIYNSDCCVVVYDTTNMESWNKAMWWIDKIKKKSGIKMPVCLVGNKIDLESKRRIHKADVHTYMRQTAMQNIVMAECSASSGENAFEVYQLIVNFAKKPTNDIWTTRLKTPESRSGCVIV